MSSQELKDLQHEVGATRTVRASVLTLVTSIHQRLEAIVRAHPVASLDLSRAVSELAYDIRGSREGLADAVLANTAIAPLQTDVDHSHEINAVQVRLTPPPSDVYGSTGPGDPNNQRGTSEGYAGTDRPKPGSILGITVADNLGDPAFALNQGGAGGEAEAPKIDYQSVVTGAEYQQRLDAYNSLTNVGAPPQEASPVETRPVMLGLGAINPLTGDVANPVTTYPARSATEVGTPAVAQDGPAPTPVPAV